MSITPSLRTGIAVIATFTLWLTPWHNRAGSAFDLFEATGAVMPAAHTFEFRDEADAELAQWALTQFKRAGLELPPLVLAFHDDKHPCNGHTGYYRSGNPARVDICGFNWDRFIIGAKKTILHELGHAWAGYTLTEEARQRFVDLRGLTTWGDDRSPWEEQGSEQTAEIMAWALLDQDLRMSSIPDSHPLALARAYFELTGTVPMLRIVGILQRP